MMIPDCRGRLETALGDLQNVVVRGCVGSCAFLRGSKLFFVAVMV